MFMHQWSIGLARIYALDALEKEIRRRHSSHRPEPRRTLRKALGRGLAAAGRALSRLGERLARSSSAEPRPLGCG